MKISEVYGENFGPFNGEFRFVLNDRGLVLVQGVNEVSTSSDSNGSGKSYLMEGIVWCPYGKTIRYDLMGERTGDQIVNVKAKKGCFVGMKIEASGSEIEIIRYRKHKTHKNSVQVTVDGVDRTLGTNKETEAFIVDLLGIDYKTFIRSVYFHGQYVQPFPTLADKEIKDIFEKILGLEDLKKVAELVKKRKTEGRNEISLIQNRISMSDAAASDAALEILTSRQRKEQFEEDKKKRIKSVETEKNTAERELAGEATLLTKESELETKVKEIELKLQKTEVVNQMITDFNAKLQTLTQDKTKNELEISNRNTLIPTIGPDIEISGRLATNRAETNNFLAQRTAALNLVKNSQSLIGQPCGECGKLYCESDMEDVISKQNDIAAELETEIKIKSQQEEHILKTIDENIAEKKKVVEAERDQFQIALNGVNQQISDSEEERTKLEGLAKVRQEFSQAHQTAKNDLAGISSQKTIFDHHRATVASLESRISTIDAEANPYDADIARWDQKEKEAAAQVTSERLVWAERTKSMQYLEILDQAYGRAGLKSHILETVTPALNQKANEYAQKLTDGDVFIEFSTVKKNKDGTLSEKFSVTVQNSAGAESYLGNSSGEQKKIDLAIGLALSDLVSARSSRAIDLWVADEIAESLDPTALERVVGILQDKAKTTGTVLVISHTNMRDHIPNVVEVVKKARGSIIEDAMSNVTSSMEAA